jgi:hypothetical protein
MKNPSSASVVVYVSEIAPVIVVHEVAAEVVQRCQIYVTAGTGDPPKDADAVKVEPNKASPVGVIT